MKETCYAIQLSCGRPLRLSSNGPKWMHDYIVPWHAVVICAKVLHQTYNNDHKELDSGPAQHCPKISNMGFMAMPCAINTFWESWSPDHCRPSMLTITAHGADFFRHVLLFLAGDMYWDINSWFLLSIYRVLRTCETCCLVTCIEARDSYIHQSLFLFV